MFASRGHVIPRVAARASIDSRYCSSTLFSNYPPPVQFDIRANVNGAGRISHHPSREGVSHAFSFPTEPKDVPFPSCCDHRSFHSRTSLSGIVISISIPIPSASWCDLGRRIRLRDDHRLTVDASPATVQRSTFSSRIGSAESSEMKLLQYKGHFALLLLRGHDHESRSLFARGTRTRFPRPLAFDVARPAYAYNHTASSCA